MLGFPGFKVSRLEGFAIVVVRVSVVLLLGV